MLTISNAPSTRFVRGLNLVINTYNTPINSKITHIVNRYFLLSFGVFACLYEYILISNKKVIIVNPINADKL